MKNNIYNQFRSWLSEKTLDEVIYLYNKEVARRGWVSVRAIYIKALEDDLFDRGVTVCGRYQL
jgi:hypothetical protein